MKATRIPVVLPSLALSLCRHAIPHGTPFLKRDRRLPCMLYFGDPVVADARKRGRVEFPSRGQDKPGWVGSAPLRSVCLAVRLPGVFKVGKLRVSWWLDIEHEHRDPGRAGAAA